MRALPSPLKTRAPEKKLGVLNMASKILRTPGFKLRRKDLDFGWGRLKNAQERQSSKQGSELFSFKIFCLLPLAYNHEAQAQSSINQGDE